MSKLKKRVAKPGDILRYDRAWSTDIRDDPSWVIVLTVEPNNTQAVYLCGGRKVMKIKRPAVGSMANPPFSTLITDGVFVDDHDQVPDEVWAALAKWRLSQ